MTLLCPDFLRPVDSCFVIAEAGVNHNGDISLAHQLIDAAKSTGADAVKFQAFVTEEIVTLQAPKAGYQLESTGAGEQFSMLKALELSGGQQAELKRHCEEVGLTFLSTPYDLPSLHLLNRLDIAAYKIASTDLDNLPFLREVGATKRPVILSTGMAAIDEIEPSVAVLREASLPWIVLLQCTSEYPAPTDEINLRAMQTLERHFDLPVGFSDHTEGIFVGPLAVVAGACVLEKHFTLDRALPGPDHKASLNVAAFKQLVDAVREVEKIRGDGIKRVTPSELRNKPRMRKSVVAARDIQAGEIIQPCDVACKRPGDGLPPVWADRFVGKRAAVSLVKDQQFATDSVIW